MDFQGGNQLGVSIPNWVSGEHEGQTNWIKYFLIIFFSTLRIVFKKISFWGSSFTFSTYPTKTIIEYTDNFFLMIMMLGL